MITESNAGGEKEGTVALFLFPNKNVRYAAFLNDNSLVNSEGGGYICVAVGSSEM